jgi:hypothetical protein
MMNTPLSRALRRQPLSQYSNTRRTYSRAQRSTAQHSTDLHTYADTEPGLSWQTRAI